MRKYPRPAGQQLAVRRHPFRECGLKFCRLLARGRKYVAIAKTSFPAEGGWLEFASQSAIFMGPVGAMLLGSGSRWGFVNRFGDPAFLVLYLLPSSTMGHLHCQYLLRRWLGNRCLPKLLTISRSFNGIQLGRQFFPTFWVWVRINLSPEKLKHALRIIHIVQRPASASWRLWDTLSRSRSLG